MGYGDLGCEQGRPFSGCQPERALPAVSVSGLVKPKCHCLHLLTIQLVMDHEQCAGPRDLQRQPTWGRKGRNCSGYMRM